MDGAGQPVELGDDDHVNLAAPSGFQERIHCGPSFLRPADTVVYVLHGAPSTSRGEGTEREQLVVWRLILRGDSGVDRSAHRLCSSSWRSVKHESSISQRASCHT